MHIEISSLKHSNLHQLLKTNAKPELPSLYKQITVIELAIISSNEFQKLQS